MCTMKKNHLRLYHETKYHYMKKLYTSIILAGLGLGAMAQPTLVPTTDISEIVQEHFMGNGIFVSNITFNGQPASGSHSHISAFNDPYSSIGIENGIMLSTGPGIETLVDGQSSNDAMYSPQDADALSLANDVVNVGEASVLEFDFIATGDSVAFQYVFGSSEYLEFVGTQFNDQFGFFLSGPGINGSFSSGAINLAVLPGTNTPVGINSINADVNSEYFIYSENLGGYIPQNIDGHTVVLHACIGQLQIGQVYHIKLIIADMTDSALDSSVFLSGSSFEQYCNEPEGEPGGIQSQVCLLSTIEARVDYTLECGTISMSNESNVSLEVSNCFYDMGDGTIIPACNGVSFHNYDSPGIYDIKLIYESNGFQSIFDIDNVLISEFPAAQPSINFNGVELSITNYDGTSQIQWYLNDVAIDGANNSLFMPTQIGNYSVSVNNGCPIFSEASTIVGVGNELMLSQINIFPNPSEGIATITLPQNTNTIVIYDALGKLVKSYNTLGAARMEISLESGMYFIQAIDSNASITTTIKHLVK